MDVWKLRQGVQVLNLNFKLMRKYQSRTILAWTWTCVCITSGLLAPYLLRAPNSYITLVQRGLTTHHQIFWQSRSCRCLFEWFFLLQRRYSEHPRAGCWLKMHKQAPGSRLIASPPQSCNHNFAIANVHHYQFNVVTPFGRCSHASRITNPLCGVQPHLIHLSLCVFMTTFLTLNAHNPMQSEYKRNRLKQSGDSKHIRMAIQRSTVHSHVLTCKFKPEIPPSQKTLHCKAEKPRVAKFLVRKSLKMGFRK